MLGVVGWRGLRVGVVATPGVVVVTDINLIAIGGFVISKGEQIKLQIFTVSLVLYFRDCHCWRR